MSVLQSKTQSLLEKISQLETLSDEKFFVPFGERDTYSHSVKIMEKLEDRINNANNEIEDILMSIELIRTDVKGIVKNITTINGTLKKGKVWSKRFS